MEKKRCTATLLVVASLTVVQVATLWEIEYYNQFTNSCMAYDGL